MALTTKGYPYPVGTDRIMDGDDAIKSLAEAVDTKLGMMASGTATVPITAANTVASVSVSLPARFAGRPAPAVMSSASANAPQTVRQPTVAGVSSSGFTIYGWRASGTTSFLVNWISVTR